jgi:hypothetical protein
MEECLFHFATPYWSQSESDAQHGRGHTCRSRRAVHTIPPPPTMPQSSGSDMWCMVDVVVASWPTMCIIMGSFTVDYTTTLWYAVLYHF